MIRVSVMGEVGTARKFLAEILERVNDRAGLHEAMGARLADELRDYFVGRNAEPNKRGWRKLNWWAGVASATGLESFDSEGAVVTVAHDKGFALKLRGGEIVPREASALTIPNVEEAYGKSVAEYEQETGRRLFRSAGGRYLAYGDEGSVTLVYFLVKRVVVKADETMLPTTEALTESLRETVVDYLEFAN